MTDLKETNLQTHKKRIMIVVAYTPPNRHAALHSTAYRKQCNSPFPALDEYD